MPPRTTRKSDRRKVSDRTMVGTAQPACLFASATQRRRHHSAMNLKDRQNHRVSSHDWGWTSTPGPVEGEPFLLTAPFIELHNQLACLRQQPNGVVTIAR